MKISHTFVIAIVLSLNSVVYADILSHLAPPTAQLIKTEKKHDFYINSNTQVLFVEDDENVVRETIAILTEKLNIPKNNITTVNNTTDALNYTNSVDGSNLIIILDNSLKGDKLTGFRISPELRNNFPNALMIFNSLDAKSYSNIPKAKSIFDAFAEKSDIYTVIKSITTSFSINENTKVLLVEDVDDTAEITVSDLLYKFEKLKEANITHVKNTDNALAYAEKYSNDKSNLIIILDNNMENDPRKGIEIAPELRKIFPRALMVFNSSESPRYKKAPDAREIIDIFVDRKIDVADEIERSL